MKNLLPLLALSLLLANCNRPDKDTVTVGGKGGSGTLKAIPAHHKAATYNCKVYIKYNSLDRPANNVYDDSAVCVPLDGKSVATFAGLKDGKYYLYAYGYDTAYARNVKGASPFNLSGQQSTEVSIEVGE